MTWDHLLREGAVQPHMPTKAEFDRLRGVVTRNLADASLRGLSADNRLGLAYEAALALARMAVHAAGYAVPVGVPRAHALTLEGAELALGPALRHELAYFNAVRKRRNTMTYDVAGSVDAREAQDALGQAARFERAVEAWLAANAPGLSRRRPSLGARILGLLRRRGGPAAGRG